MPTPAKPRQWFRWTICARHPLRAYYYHPGAPPSFDKWENAKLEHLIADLLGCTLDRLENLTGAHLTIYTWAQTNETAAPLLKIQKSTKLKTQVAKFADIWLLITGNSKEFFQTIRSPVRGKFNGSDQRLGMDPLCLALEQNGIEVELLWHTTAASKRNPRTLRIRSGKPMSITSTRMLRKRTTPGDPSASA